MLCGALFTYLHTYGKPHIHSIVLKSLAVCVAGRLTDKTLYNAVYVWFGKCLAIIYG